MRPDAGSVLCIWLFRIMALLAGVPAAAQCDGRWLDGLTGPGVGGPAVRGGASVGEGRIAVLGSITDAGFVRGSGVPLWDGVNWSWLGDTLSGDVTAIVEMGAGRLAAAGAISVNGSTLANRVAVWDGQAWSALGGAFDDQILALAVLPDGTLVAGGAFTAVGGVSASRLAAWDGSGWSALGGGVNGAVWCLAVLGDGALAVGGGFTKAAGASARQIAVWNGLVWTSPGAGVGTPGAIVTAISPRGEHGFVMTGSFDKVGSVSASRVAIWTGEAWSVLGTGIEDGTGYSVLALPSGEIVVGGIFTRVGGVEAKCIARWDGAAWLEMEPSGSKVRQILGLVDAGDGSVVALGDFDEIGGVLARGVGRWEGGVWKGLGNGLDGGVTGFATLADGSVALSGFFRTAGEVPATGMLTFDGGSWMGPTGWPIAPSIFGECRITNRSGDGRLVGTGLFSVAGMSPAFFGEFEWSPGGGRFINSRALLNPSSCSSVVAIPGGWMFGGSFVLAQGSAGVPVQMLVDGKWSIPGEGLQSASSWQVQRVSVLRGLGDGRVLAGGRFDRSGMTPTRNLAVWDGASWSEVGGGITRGGDAGSAWVTEIAVLADGRVVVGGDFDRAGDVPAERIAMWDGSSWRALGEGIGPDGGIAAIAELRDGSIVVGGSFSHAGGLSVGGLARWDGHSWSGLGEGVSGGWNGMVVESICEHRSGEILVGGGFERAGGRPSPFFARWSPTGVPWFTVQPEASMRVCVGARVELIARVASGYGDLTYAWLRNGEPIDPMQHPTALTPTLVLGAVSAADEGVYECRVVSACGSATSSGAELRVCAADRNCDGDVDWLDFEAFFDCWELSEACADVDGSGEVDLLDFFAFFNAWDVGC